MAIGQNIESAQTHAPGQHPDLPPPPGTTGLVGWLRENLFAGPANAVGTILTLVVLYMLIVPILQWALFDAVVSGSDRYGCDIGRYASNIGNSYEAFDPDDLALDPKQDGIDVETSRLWSLYSSRYFSGT